MFHRKFSVSLKKDFIFQVHLYFSTSSTFYLQVSPIYIYIYIYIYMYIYIYVGFQTCSLKLKRVRGNDSFLINL